MFQGIYERILFYIIRNYLSQINRHFKCGKVLFSTKKILNTSCYTKENNKGIYYA